MSIEGVLPRRDGRENTQSALPQAVGQKAADVLEAAVGSAQEGEDKPRSIEQELRASKEALDLAINGAQLGTFYCDMPPNHIVWNDTCKDHFFLPHDATVDFDLFYARLHPDDREPTRQAVMRCIEDGVQYNMEYRTVAPDGRMRWINAIGKTYYDEEGKPLRFDGITIDITEQKTREQTLNFLIELNDATRQMQEPEEIMATAARLLGEFMRVSRCAYATVEADEDHFTIYKDYTNGCASCAGSYRLELFGPRAVAQLRAGQTYIVRDRDREATVEDDLAAFRAIDIQAIICTSLIKSGRFAAMMAVHQTEPRQWTAGEIKLMEMVAERSWAIIERAYADKRLKERSEEIAALNIQLRRSIQETHHRVKNNLQIIAALAELQMDDDAMVPAAALKRMSQHTRSLAAIHDLLTQQIKDDAHTDSISAKAIMNKLVPLLQITAGERSLYCLSDDFMLPVREGASLTLLASELVGNAIKHGAGAIRVTLHQEAETARLTVTDEGKGFPDGFNAAKAANTGLSLIDSTGRYDLRGTIVYQNRPTGGAQVVVTFPITRTEEKDTNELLFDGKGAI